MTVTELWNTMPRSEKIAGIAIAVFFPIVFAAIAVILP